MNVIANRFPEWPIFLPLKGAAIWSVLGEALGLDNEWPHTSPDGGYVFWLFPLKGPVFACLHMEI